MPGIDPTKNKCNICHSHPGIAALLVSDEYSRTSGESAPHVLAFSLSVGVCGENVFSLRYEKPMSNRILSIRQNSVDKLMYRYMYEYIRIQALVGRLELFKRVGAPAKNFRPLFEKVNK